MPEDRLDIGDLGSSDMEAQERPAGPAGPAVSGAAPLPLGRVASPLNHESTTEHFFFWVPPGTLVEKTHLVVTRCSIAGQQLTYYGVVEEVYRRSRARNMDGEVDLYDADLTYEPPFTSGGITFAETTLLRTDPPLLTPPLERSDVLLAGIADARQAYGYDDMISDGVDWSLAIGLLRNGGSGQLGPALLDLRDLCGERAGHLNVTGQAGRGTKSSFLLVLLRMLIDRARAWIVTRQDQEPFSVRPIVFNVKGEDLMYIDAPNRYLNDEMREVWAAMGGRPEAFTDAEFYAPSKLDNGGPNRGEPRVRRPVAPGRETKPYFWTLADVVRFGLWPYLFSEDALTSEPMSALVDHVLTLISERCAVSTTNPLGVRLRVGELISGREVECPQSFDNLRDALAVAIRDGGHPFRDGNTHTSGTCRALRSRLGGILDQDGRAIFEAGIGLGRPLDVLRDDKHGTIDPLVIDIATLPPDLRRFVVAAVLQQVKDRQTSSRVKGQVYLLVLDELGLYAPRGARDPITRLIEHVAAQLRSQGIILLGAQQQASRVSETIFGNSEVKALGASSPVEIESSTWSRLLSSSQKARALVLRPDEKLINAGGQWMNVVVPFPAWAMKLSEADPGWRAGTASGATGGSPNGSAGTNGSAGAAAPPFTLNPLAE